ncbi:MAG: tripartite tricarboxylate transporter substrate-binding protein [Bauldia litoralis]
MEITRISTVAAFAMATMISTGATTIATAEEVDFSGKTITIVVGFGAGGGYDAYGRLAADHLGKHLEGNPTVIVENMPGGAGQRSAVYMATAAPKDGTSITVIPASIAFDAIRGGMASEIEPLAFRPIGRLTSIIEAQLTWHDSPTKTFADAQERETLVAGDGARGNASTVLSVMNARFGAKFNPVLGYKGTADMALAMERGEVEGIVHPLQTLDATHPDWVSENKVNFLWQQATARHPDYPEIPAIVEFADDAEGKALLSLLARQGEIGRSLSAPPGTPPETVEAFRAAFDAMIVDPDFIADARTRNLPLDPATGEEVEELIAATIESPAEVTAELNRILEAVKE